jgi:protein kinase-like protein/uncharacterized protein DUF4384
MSSEPTDDKTVIAPAGGASADRPGADSLNALPVGTRIGEFEIIGLIGEGGFGIVYLCEDHSLGRRVALKEYMPASLASRNRGNQVSVKSERHAETFEAGRRSFVNEARLLAQFDHPGLVKVYRFWEANGTAYMVMPFYEGITLKQELQGRNTPPEEAWLKHLLAPLMAALERLHSAQVFHRDIAPDNILLLADGRPVLLDLGAARRVIGDMTQALTVILKPGYAPIEQYADDPSLKQGAWTDIYALAAVIYLAVVGKTPIPSVGRMMKDNLAPASQLAAGRYSAGFLLAVDRGLAPKPEDRPQTIAEFRALLGIDPMEAAPPRASPSPLPAQAAGASVAPTAGPGASPPAKRSRIGLALAAAGLAAASVAGYFFYASGTPTPPAATGQTPASPPPVAVAETPAPLPSGPMAVPPVPGVNPGAPGRIETVINDEDGQQHRVTIDTDAQGRQTITMLDADGKKQTISMTPQGIPGVTAKAAPSTAPAPAAGPFSPRDELRSILQGGDPDHAVSVAPDKSTVRIGQDKLGFHLRSTKPGYAYVLMVGSDQHVYLLFPNAVDRNNKIAADRSVALPRPGWAMESAGPPGINDFLVVVSDAPRDFAATGLKKVDPFAEFPLDKAAKLAAGPREGGLSPFLGKPVCPTPECSANYGAAMFAIEEVRAGTSR